MSRIYERKDYYVNYLNEKGVDLNKHLDLTELRQHVQLDPEPFYNFADQYREESLQKYFKPRPFFNFDSMRQTVFLNDLGYNEQNTYEYNYGIQDKHNDMLKEMLGDSAFEQLHIDKTTAGIRLLEYTPGNGIPLHTDSYNAFKDKNKKETTVHRYFVAISPWSWGHFLQVHDNMITHWTPGDVIEIPNDIFHLSANFGIETKLTLTVTGYRI